MATKKSAFNLIEMSIVLLVIGLIVAGIAGATSLTRSAKLSGARQITNASPVVLSTSNLGLWLETSLVESFDKIKETNDDITVWNDINKTSNNPYQAVAGTAKPKYDLTAINGLPGVKLDPTGTPGPAVSSFLQIPNFRADAYFTLFVLGKFDLGVSGAMIIEHGPDASNSSNDGFYFSGYGLVPNPVSVRRTSVFATSGFSPNWFGSNPAIGVARHGSDGITYKLNNASFQTLLDAGNVSDVPATETLNIGTRNGGTGTSFTNGSFGEIIFYNRALDDDEVDDILEYLNRKWKIY